MPCGLTLAEVPTQAGSKTRPCWLPLVFLVLQEGCLQCLRVISVMFGSEGREADSGGAGGGGAGRPGSPPLPLAGFSQ